jgi:sialate O-acetylesterase
MRIIKFNHILILFLIIFQSVFSQVKLPCLLSDGMVLQRDTDIRIWGRAAPNEKLTVKINHRIYMTTADQKGDWQVVLSPMKAGGPYILEINSSNQIQLKNILVGDVWLCSGQSNMELTMKRVSSLYENVIAQSENPSIRYFDVPDRYHFNNPLSDLESGKWESANPSTVLDFSAVAYFFARAL